MGGGVQVPGKELPEAGFAELMPGAEAVEAEVSGEMLLDMDQDGLQGGGKALGCRCGKGGAGQTGVGTDTEELAVDFFPVKGPHEILRKDAGLFGITENTEEGRTDGWKGGQLHFDNQAGVGVSGVGFGKGPLALPFPEYSAAAEAGAVAVLFVIDNAGENEFDQFGFFGNPVGFHPVHSRCLVEAYLRDFTKLKGGFCHHSAEKINPLCCSKPKRVSDTRACNRKHQGHTP